MNYTQLSLGTTKVHTPFIARPTIAQDIIKTGGYADLFEGRLEIKIESPHTHAHKRYCKPKGFSDQGYRHD